VCIVSSSLDFFFALDWHRLSRTCKY